MGFETSYDELERDHDEPYEPEERDRFDAWYEEFIEAE